VSWIRYLAVLFTIVVISAPLSSSAQGTPEATPAPTCVFPPISIDLLREIRDDIAENPPPTPTPPLIGITSELMHILPFPPPPGEPIVEETVDSIRHFLDRYAECVVIGQIAPTYGAWTEDFIRRSLGSEVERVDAIINVIGFESETPMFPHPGISLLLLRAWRIETGHVVAVMQIVGISQYWTMLLVPNGDSWLIDDIWSADERMIGDNVSGPVYATPIVDDSIGRTIETSATAAASD
jgi:hypothetical protein